MYDSGQDLYNLLKQQRKLLSDTVKAMKDTGRKLADFERNYRIAYRKEVLRLHIQDDVAWTACADLAKGDETVAELRFKRDIAKSDYEVCQEKIMQTKLEIRILETEITEERRGS